MGECVLVGDQSILYYSLGWWRVCGVNLGYII